MSARVFGNLVFIDRTKQKEKGDVTIKESITSAAKRKDWQALASQFINKVAVDALANDEAVDFMMARSELMYETASQLVGKLA